MRLVATGCRGTGDPRRVFRRSTQFEQVAAFADGEVVGGGVGGIRVQCEVRCRPSLPGARPSPDVDPAGRDRLQYAEHLGHLQRRVMRQHDARAADADAARWWRRWPPSGSRVRCRPGFRTRDVRRASSGDSPRASQCCASAMRLADRRRPGERPETNGGLVEDGEQRHQGCGAALAAEVVNGRAGLLANRTFRRIGPAGAWR